MSEDYTKDILIGLGGGGLLATALHKTIKDLPGESIFKTLSDYTHNFPRGYYNVGKAGKVGKLAWEGTKGVGRMGRSFVNIPMRIAEKTTGIPDYLYRDHLSGEREIQRIKNDYIKNYGKGGMTFNKAKTLVRNIEKQTHYKLINDYGNRFLYNVPPGNDALAKYAKQYVTGVSQKTFVKDIGSRKIADFIASRQPGAEGVAGVKWLRHINPGWGDVLRGAQFDRNFYSAMKMLKGFKGDHKDAMSMMHSMMERTDAKALKNGKMAFSLAPSIRPNYDWGGYNAVGVWDPKDPHKITIAASDRRDLGPFRGKRVVVNYVKPKTIDINVLTKEVKNLDDIPRKRPEGTYKRGAHTKGKTVEQIMAKRAEETKLFRTRQGGGSIVFNFDKPFNAYINAKQRAINTLKKPKLSNVAGRKQLAKLAPSILKRMGIAGGIAAAAYALLNKE